MFQRYILVLKCYLNRKESPLNEEIKLFWNSLPFYLDYDDRRRVVYYFEAKTFTVVKILKKLNHQKEKILAYYVWGYTNSGRVIKKAETTRTGRESSFGRWDLRSRKNQKLFSTIQKKPTVKVFFRKILLKLSKN